MIGYLKGKVLDHSGEGKMLVAVGSGDSVVGYSVSVPYHPSYGAWSVGKSIELFIYTHVREEAFDLYGFVSRGEKELFLTLLGVNGIGPKSALGILSHSEPAKLIDAILKGDKEHLVQIPGIGKKSAERVVLELGDSVRKKVEAGIFAEIQPRVADPGISPLVSTRDSSTDCGGAVFEDAKAALVGLGYRDQEAGALLGKVLAGLEEPPIRAEDLIKSALRQLAQ